MTYLDAIDISLNVSYPILFLIIIIVIAYTYYIYRYTIPPISKFLKLFLIFLRTLAIALIFLLIFEPTLILKYNKSIDPKNLIFVDNSNSIVNKDSADRVKLVNKFLSDYSQSVDGENLFYSFGSSIDSIENPNKNKLTFNGNRSNFEQLKTFIDKSKFIIASATIVSDGIVNDGSSSASDFERLGIPIYTVSIGDSTVQTDIAIKKVIYNDLIYNKSSTELRAVLFNQYLANKNVTVFLYEDSKLIDQKNVKLAQSGLNNISFTYTPQFSGEKNLFISVSRLENEETFDNNQYPFIVNILDDKIKVLLIAGAPSYDLTIIKQLLNNNEKIEVNENIQLTKNKLNLDDEFKSRIDSSDIIFMIDFPAQFSPSALISSLTDAIKEKKKSFFFILSQSVDQQKLNSFDVYLPFKIQNISDEFREIVPNVNSIADPLVSTNSSNISLWNNLPPIFQTESKILSTPSSKVLVNSKYKSIESSTPLVITSSIGASRSIILNGFGIWKWKLQRNENTEFLLESFLNNSIKWLNADNQKERIFVKPIKKVFAQNDDIEFRASIYDETLTPRNNANITVTARSGSDSFDFELRSIGNGLYEGRSDISKTGDYSYISKIELDNATIIESGGKFAISDIDIENINYVLNKNYLKFISNITSGKSFEISEYEELFNTLNFNYQAKVSNESVSTKDNIWENEWILGLIVLIFSIEWFLRKKKGLL